MNNLSEIYKKRFSQTGLDKRLKVWKILCPDFFQKRVGQDQTILELACGYGEFINTIRAKKKYAIDLNSDAQSYLGDEVEFYLTAADKLDKIEDESIDVVFTSNFLEHLPDKSTCDAVFQEVRRKLRPGGCFMILGPNIRYAYKEYWDYYDHYLPLSHLSLAEGLQAAGYDVEELIPRFLPYTMNNSLPTGDFLIRVYLALPFVWPLFGKQFFAIAKKNAP